MEKNMFFTLIFFDLQYVQENMATGLFDMWCGNSFYN